MMMIYYTIKKTTTKIKMKKTPPTTQQKKPITAEFLSVDIKFSVRKSRMIVVEEYATLANCASRMCATVQLVIGAHWIGLQLRTFVLKGG